VSSFHLAWQSPTGSYRTPIVDVDGDVFTAGTQITARDVWTGALRWHAPGNAGPLAGANGLMQAGNGLLTARDTNNGSVLWAKPFAGTAVTAAGDVYGVESFGGATRVRSFRSATGASVWSTTIGTAAANTPAVVGGDVVVIDRAGVVHELSNQGQPGWTRATALRTVGSPVVAHGSVFVAGETAAGVPEVIALQESNGAVRWSRSLTPSEPVQTNMAVDDDTLFLATNTQLRAYDLNGRPRWSTALTSPSPPTVAGNDVFVSSNHRLVAFDVADGSTMFTSAELGAAPLSTPVDADGFVFVAGDRLYAFHASWFVIPQNEVNFRKISIGAESSGQQLDFKNYSGAEHGPLALEVTGPDAAAFHLANDTCTGVTLAAASECDAEVSFTPTETRGYSAAVALMSAGATLVAEPLRGRGSAITISPSQLDFGSWHYGTSSPEHLFTVTNTGPRTRHLAVDLEPDNNNTNWRQTTNTCRTLDPGKSCTMGVTFSSAIEHLPPDIQHATVYVCDTDRLCETVSQAALTATGIPAVDITGGTDFGNVTVGHSVSHTLTVTNVSANATGPLSISRTVFAEEFAAITANSCNGVSLSSAASCTFDVTMTPFEAATFTDSLFVSSSIVLTAGVTLTVTGVAP
jgi:hypothetical protein